VAFVVTECPHFGAVTVYLNAHVLKTLSTYSPTTKREVVILLPQFSLQRATITLKAMSKGRLLIVEGLEIG